MIRKYTTSLAIIAAIVIATEYSLRYLNSNSPAKLQLTAKIFPPAFTVRRLLTPHNILDLLETDPKLFTPQQYRLPEFSDLEYGVPMTTYSAIRLFSKQLDLYKTQITYQAIFDSNFGDIDKAREIADAISFTPRFVNHPYFNFKMTIINSDLHLEDNAVNFLEALTRIIGEYASQDYKEYLAFEINKMKTQNIFFDPRGIYNLAKVEKALTQLKSIKTNAPYQIADIKIIKSKIFKSISWKQRIQLWGIMVIICVFLRRLYYSSKSRTKPS